MIHIAVAEDEDSDLQRLKEALARYQEEQHVSFRITVFRNGREILDGYQAEYDIVILDIEMKEMDGMTAARRIREVDEDVVLVFITKVSGYALEGYKVDALDYIIKPISYFSFSQTMRRAIRRAERNREKSYLVVSAGGTKTRLDISRICYIEVRDHDLIYHMEDGTYTAAGSITNAENELRDERFFRCSRFYIVNLDYVESFEKGVLKVHGDTISVSRGRKTEFLEAMNRHVHR